MKAIFISYARHDLKVVKKFEQALSEREFSVWRDQEKIRGAQNWPRAIGEGIAASDIVLLFWSGRAAKAHFVEFEWSTAIALRKPILPIFLDKTPLPASMKMFNGFFLQDFDETLSKLLDSFKIETEQPDQAHRKNVLDRLDNIESKEASEVVSAAQAIFEQQGWRIQGNVYQAARDVNITIQGSDSSRERPLLARWQSWVVLVSAIVVLLGAVTDLPNKFIAAYQTISRATPTCDFYGRVMDVQGQAVVGAQIIVQGKKGSGFTDDNGEFKFEVAEKAGNVVQILVKQANRISYNGRETLPGPANIQLKD